MMKSLKELPYFITLPCAAIFAYIAITSIQTGVSPELLGPRRRAYSDRILKGTLRVDEPLLFWFKTGSCALTSLLCIYAASTRFCKEE